MYTIEETAIELPSISPDEETIPRNRGVAWVGQEVRQPWAAETKWRKKGGKSDTLNLKNLRYTRSKLLRQIIKNSISNSDFLNFVTSVGEATVISRLVYHKM